MSICPRLYLNRDHSKTIIRHSGGRLWAQCGLWTGRIAAFTSLLFSGKWPAVLSFSLSQQWAKTNTDSELLCDIQASKQVHIHHNWAANLICVLLYQSHIVLTPKATHTLSDSHTGQYKIVYCLMKGNFPNSHHTRQIQLYYCNSGHCFYLIVTFCMGKIVCKTGNLTDEH